jgi:hypothetical protein
MISPLFLMNPVALVSRAPSFFPAATPAQAVHDKESPLITYLRHLPKTKNSSNGLATVMLLGASALAAPNS